MTAMLDHCPQEPHGATPPETLAGKARRFLARNLRTKTLDLAGTPPMVSFTFDDVAVSACGLGARILEQHGARGTYYVAGRGCGSADGISPPLASIGQLRTLWARGHEIGCHTYSHPAVSRISLGELDSEIATNRTALKQIDGKIEARNFAYPYGDMSFRTKRHLENRFDSCRSVHPGINRVVADLGALKAWPLESAALDRRKIAALIADTASNGGWLIFYSHDVAERPLRYGVSPDLLDYAVGAAKAAACMVLTIGEGLHVARRRAPVDREAALARA
jgi:peptidoglycan/xylan/chitin deacetylase (PgdA/CDA1 family)